MKKKNFFTYLPSPPYFTFPFHIRQTAKSAFLSSVPDGSLITGLSGNFIRQLNGLLEIPGNYKAVLFNSEYEFQSFLSTVYFLSGSVNPVHGSRGQEWGEFLEHSGYHTETFQINVDQKHQKPKELQPGISANVFMNEADSGSCLGSNYLESLNRAADDAFINVDLTDCVPCIRIGFSGLSSFSFSFNTSFGLPYNVVIWYVDGRILNDFLAAFKGRQPAKRLNELLPGLFYSGLPDLMFLDVAAKVLADLNSRGLKNIVNETKYKSAIIDHAVSGNPSFIPAIKEPVNRSMTTIVLNYQGESDDITLQFAKQGIVTDRINAQGPLQKIRITNFPVHSREQFEMLADLLKNIN